MNAYRYEPHLHTAETSRCGHSAAADLVAFYAARGYAGIFVTDHFLGGNTTVPERLPWAERIEKFCRGYTLAAAAGARAGLEVLFAWEHGFGWTHLLTYGLPKEWLLDHPDMLEWEDLEYIERVQADGGGIVHAHPFREHQDRVLLFPGKVDAIEVLNACRPDEVNRHAREFAASFGLPQTAGSDIHSIHQQRLCGVAVSQRLRDGRDYLDALKTGTAEIFDDR